MSKEIAVSITDQLRPLDDLDKQALEHSSVVSTVASDSTEHEAKMHLKQAQAMNIVQSRVQAAKGEGASMDRKSLDDTLLNSSSNEQTVIKKQELPLNKEVQVECVSDNLSQESEASLAQTQDESRKNAQTHDATEHLEIDSGKEVVQESAQTPVLESVDISSRQEISSDLEYTEVDELEADLNKQHDLQKIETAGADFLLDPINTPVQEKDLKALASSDMVSGGYIDYGRAGKIDEARVIAPDKQYFKPWLASYPADVPEFVDTHCYENLDDLFMTAVEAYGEHEAYVNMESSLTFNEVGDLATAFAAFVQVNLGMKKGDKLAIMLPNVMQYPVVFFGALKAGLIVININPLYTPRELEIVLSSSDAETIVVLANFAHNLQPIIDKTKLKHVIVASLGDCLGTFKGLIVDTVVHFKGLVPHFSFEHMVTLRSALRRGFRKVGAFVKPEINYDDIALLQFTGGTTGRSKGAMLSHGNLISNVAQAIGVYGSRLKGTQEAILTVIPLYHIFALTINLVLMFEIGAKNILITDPRNTKDFAKTVRKHTEISTLTGVNTLFNILVNHPDFQDINFENLHLVIGGGAAVQSGVEQRFFERTGLHILEGYGLTECSPLCAVCPYTTDHYTGSIGLIVPSTIARIVDVNGEEIHDLERTGELEIKGPQVMHGYYKCDESQNERAFDDGYLRTGDIARWMEGGYIKLIDRLKDMILVSGFNVFPSEIEDVVSRFNRVLECAVIGVPSDKTGEAVKLFIVKKDPSLTEEEVRNYCRAYLTPYKVPAIIEFVSVLPKSTLGKVLRRELRANNTSVQMQVANQPRNDDVLDKTNQVLGEMVRKDELSARDASYSDSTKISDTTPKANSIEPTDSIDSTGTTGSTESKLPTELAETHLRRSAGVLALEKLLSSKSDGFGAATDTPNIHKQEERLTKWLREDQKEKLSKEQAFKSNSAQNSLNPQGAPTSEQIASSHEQGKAV